MANWTKQENLILTVYYCHADPDSLLKLLPRRTLSAIYYHAWLLRLKKIKWLKPRSRFLPPKLSSSKAKPKAKPKAKVIPRPIKFWPWEKQTLLELGSHLTVVEMKILIPRRSIAQLRRMAEIFEVKFLGD